MILKRPNFTVTLLGPGIAPHFQKRYKRPSVEVKARTCVFQLYDQTEHRRFLCGAEAVNEPPHGLLCERHRHRTKGSRETWCPPRDRETGLYLYEVDGADIAALDARRIIASLLPQRIDL